MKKIGFLMLLFICSMVVAAQAETPEKKKVAILETVDKENNLDYSTKLMLRSNLSRAITNTEGYEGFDRVDVSSIMDEQQFQRTGMVSDTQIKQLGEMSGAQYILIAEGALTKDLKLFVTAKILDVESGQVVVTDNTMMGTSSAELQRGCRTLAGKLFGVMATSSTAVNQFFDKLKVQKKEEDPAVAQAKEEQRLAQEKAREELRLAQEKARGELRLAQEQAKAEQDRILAEKKEKAKPLELFKVSNNDYVYQDSHLDRKAYVDFLQKNSPQAYKQYMKGRKLKAAGWTTFVLGLAAAGGGTALYILGTEEGDGTQETSISQSSETKEILGFTLWGVGGGLVFTSIPILGVGYHKCNNAYKVYNSGLIAQNPPAQLNLFVRRQEIGLAFAF